MLYALRAIDINDRLKVACKLVHHNLRDLRLVETHGLGICGLDEYAFKHCRIDGLLQDVTVFGRHWSLANHRQRLLRLLYQCCGIWWCRCDKIIMISFG